MPIYLSSSGYGYTYKKEAPTKKPKKKIAKVFVIFAILSIVVVGLFIFKNISFGNSKSNANYVYAVRLNKIDSYDTAIKTSEYIKTGGGAGNIKALEGSYYIYLSCYKNNEDAQKIVKNLNENGYQLNIEKINLSFSKVKNLDKNKQKSFNDAFNLFFQTYTKLYDLSILLDTNSLDYNNYKLKVNEILQTNNEAISQYNSVFKNESIKQVVYLKIYLNTLQENLQTLINQSSNICSAVKECYFNIIFLAQQMQQNN